MRRHVEEILDRILAAQQKDGFLISYFIVQGLDKKWEDLRLEHQMYNAGHFFEMAIAHHRLTGDIKSLDAAKRFADHIDGIFGPGKRYDVDGHQEVELALVKLYRASGERRYLELAKFFLDERGYAHGRERKPLDPKTVVEPPKPEGPLTAEQRREYFHARLRVRNGRMQDHKPVVEQLEAVGHAVRAGYMYAAMADIVRFMDAPGYERALDHLWSDVVGRKMYLTGNVGTGQHDDEGFGDPYLLPNESAYCESCAAVAHVLWQHRMNLLKGEAKYADVMELALYNGLLSGISISGDHFFYQNPLASQGGGRRNSWIGLSCCPTNLTRIIPQIGSLAYARGKRAVYVNLYLAGEGLDQGRRRCDPQADSADRLPLGRPRAANGRAGSSRGMQRVLANSGLVAGPARAQRPVPVCRCQGPAAGAEINGQAADPSPGDDGYVHLQRRWQAGEVVELDLPMPVQRVYAHDKVRDDQGKVALMRGPIVYCLEAADNPGVDLFRLALPRGSALRAEHRSGLLGGVTVLQFNPEPAATAKSNGSGLPAEAFADGKRPLALTAVPYYAWANREPGAMTVWIMESLPNAISKGKQE